MIDSSMEWAINFRALIIVYKGKKSVLNQCRKQKHLLSLPNGLIIH